jgi:hypothetical protein
MASIRNGPISQSPGIARTRRKTTINPAKNSRNPSFRRRRRLDSPPGFGASLIGAATITASGASLIGATASTGSGALTGAGAGATTGSGAALIGAIGTVGSTTAAGGAGTASCTGGVVSVRPGSIGAPAWVAAAPPVSSCSFALAELMGAAAATWGVEAAS